MTLRSAVRGAVDAALASRNYVLRRANAPPKGHKRFLDFFNAFAPAPVTVFDIGVGRGTDWLYDAFPKSKLVLIEALEDFKPHIDKIVEERGADCVYTALSDGEGEIEFYVPRKGPTGASLFRGTPQRRERAKRRGGQGVRTVTVRTRTLDSIAGAYPGPQVVKIDVEGAELNVLRGAAKTLESASLILVETSVLPRFQGGADFVEVAAYMKSKGFALLEIVEIATQGAHEMLCYVDAAFVPAGAEFYARMLDAE